LLLLLATGVVVKTAWGQDAAKQQPPSASEGPAKICEPPRENLPREHRFWDKENRWLFAGVGAARTLDYFSTLNMRRRGRQEILLTNDRGLHRRVLSFSSLPSPQTRTLDLFGALRPGDRRRDKQLLPEDSPSEDNTLIPFSFVLPAGNGFASCSVQCGG